jgi:hypothetical protein
VWTPYGGVETSTKVLISGSGAGTNNFTIEKFGATSIYLRIYDAAAGQRINSIVTGTDVIMTPNTWKYLTACTNNAGTSSFSMYNTNNSTWYNAGTSGAGTGIISTMPTTLYFGSLATTLQADAYFHNMVLTPYASPNPLPGWTNRPSNRPY